MITPSATAPGIADIGDFIFQRITDDIQSAQMAEMQLPPLLLGILYANNDYGSFKDNWSKEPNPWMPSHRHRIVPDGDEDRPTHQVGQRHRGLYIAGYYTEASDPAGAAGYNAQIPHGFFSNLLVSGGDQLKRVYFGRVLLGRRRKRSDLSLDTKSIQVRARHVCSHVMINEDSSTGFDSRVTTEPAKTSYTI